jgi:hypothetical protein
MKPIIKISPKFTADKLSAATLPDRIDVYEDRVRGWLIDCGHILNKHEHAGFGVLQSGLAYFEGFAVFNRGEDSRNRSPEFFQAGLEAVFPDVCDLSAAIRKDFMDVMYRDGRCGLFHLGMARRRILLSDGEPVFRVSINQANESIDAIYIDRYGFMRKIDEHHTSYVARLRDSSQTELRNKFELAWALVHQ